MGTELIPLISDEHGLWASFLKFSESLYFPGPTKVLVPPEKLSTDYFLVNLYAYGKFEFFLFNELNLKFNGSPL